MIPYKDLFIALKEGGVKYMVAGGFAVNFYQVQRATVDLDLIVLLEQNNIHKFIRIMQNLGYEPALPVKAVDLADKVKRESWIREKNMTVFSFVNPSNAYEIVDVFIDEPRPFESMREHKTNVEAFGIAIPVVGVGDLIEMKEAVGRDKDIFDVQQLRKLYPDAKA